MRLPTPIEYATNNPMGIGYYDFGKRRGTNWQDEYNPALPMRAPLIMRTPDNPMGGQFLTMKERMAESFGDRGEIEYWSPAEGYGFLCGRRCVERKQAAGVLPRWQRRAMRQQAKTGIKESEAEFQRTVSEFLRTPEAKGMSGGAIAAMVLGGLLLIGGLGFVAMKAMKAKAKAS